MIWMRALPKLDLLYMTRIQQERFDDPEEYLRLKGSKHAI